MNDHSTKPEKIEPPPADAPTLITSEMRAVARYMRTHFTYQRDPGFDTWSFLTADGKIKGDCEDFALTVLYLLCGQSRKAARRAIMRGDAQIIYTSLNGRGHAVLRYNGCYIDNTQPRWAEEWRFGKRITYPRLVVAVKLLLSKVLA